MELQQPGRVTLSRTERILLTAGIAVIGGLGWRFYDGVTTKLDNVVVQQAVTNQRLHDLTTQMTDLPAMKLEQAKQRVEVDQLKVDVRELKQTRGLK